MIIPSSANLFSPPCKGGWLGKEMLEMIKEIHRGIYNAIKTGGLNIPMLASDLEEPLTRPAIKIYIKPKSSKLNSNVRLTEYEIMVLYYAEDINNYDMDHYEMEELFEDILLESIELENGVFLELEELEFENDREMLCIYTSATIDTYIDTEADDELMEELNLILKN